MKLEKMKKMLKDMLKDKRTMTIAGAMLGFPIIVMTGVLLLSNKVNEKNKVEDNKVVIVNKENTEEEKEVKKQLEDLNKMDISKLSEEDKKSIEDTKKLIEDMIAQKEYDKAKRAIDSVKTNIDNKLNEMDEKEKEEVKEENNVEKVEENKELVSNTTNSTSNNTSSNNSSNVSNSNDNSSSSSQGAVQQPTTPPVQPAPQPKPEPTPQPPVEEVKPVYPSIAEVKQRLISYGQSLGYTYNPALEYNGLDVQGTSQMWGEGLGGVADGKTLFGGMEGSEFGITVVDLSNGYVEMTLWVA